MTFGYDLWVYVAIGFLAQIIDGTLGMAFGIIVSSSLLAFGAAPAFASAAVHAAEIVTTGISGISHLWHGNVDRRLFIRLAAAGVLGGIVGAYVLADLLPKEIVRPLVAVYLFCMALLIFDRILRREPRMARIPAIPLGLGGGFLDAIGGGGWGPLVASSLVATGDEPRRSVGTVNAAEFFVAVSVSVAFFATLNLPDLWRIVLALIIGGGLAAPFAGWLVRVLPPRVAMIMVAGIVLCLSLYNIAHLITNGTD
jgi:uncharacterized membrane protein YfcA